MNVVKVMLASGLLLLLGAAPAAAGAQGSCPTWKAERDVREAKRLLERAERRLAEAKRVLAATRDFSQTYGSSVGRWVRLARRVGWRWSDLPTLLYVTDRESGGDPGVFNYQGSGAAGLLQLMPLHYVGRFDPTEPRENLAYGLKLFRGSGWRAWSL